MICNAHSYNYKSENTLNFNCYMSKFIIFDVDNVIIDTINAAPFAESALGIALSEQLGSESGDRVRSDFKSNYENLTKQAKADAGVLHEDFQTLKGRIENWQAGVLCEGWELKLWSRETLLAIALEKNGIPVTKTLIDAALDPYWAALTKESKNRSDVAEALEGHRKAGVAIHLATASDGFLDFNEREQTFVYNPQNAVRRKMNRMTILRELDFEEHDVSVGDPIGKPDARFFTRVLQDFETKLGRKIDLSQTLAVGDNLSDDVLPLLELGVARGAWLVSENGMGGPELLEGNPSVGIVNSLLKLENIPWIDG